MILTLPLIAPDLFYILTMSKEEKIIYEKLQELFPCLQMQRNYRPDFLKNPKSKNNLEIDIWIKLFSIGFEYQGMVHFKDIKYYNNDSDKSREHDLLKYDLIKKTDAKTIIEIFPSDLQGDFKKNIEFRIYNTIVNSLQLRRPHLSIIRLLFLYLYLTKNLTGNKVRMRTNRLVYADNPKCKVNFPYGELQEISRLKQIDRFKDFAKEVSNG